MIENQYLIYTYYGVTQGEESESVIYKAARRTYLDFCRRISFQGKFLSNRNMNQKGELKICL